MSRLSPWVPRLLLLTLLLQGTRSRSHSRGRPGQLLTNASNVSALGPAASGPVLGGTGPVPGGVADQYCQYCQQTGNWQCIKRWCYRRSRRPPSVSIRQSSPGATGAGPDDADRTCQYCRQIADQTCIDRWCQARGAAFGAALDPGSRLRAALFRYRKRY